MRSLKKHIVLTLLMIGIFNNAISQNRNDMRLSHDKLVLIIDLKSTRSQMDSMLKAAGITSTSADMILKGDNLNLQKDGWKIKTLPNGILQLDLSLSGLTKNPQHSPFVIFNPQKLKDSRPGYPADVPFGFNNFSRSSVQELPSGQTRFFVPGNSRAKRVIISGSFNDWSTGKQQMLRTDSGWVYDVNLQAGKHAYKFIVDGRWMTDPNNRLLEDDGAGNTNSIYYRYNYTFKLPGYPNANSVNATGNFNGYNGDQIPLVKTFNGWERRLYLKDGMYSYHFMVDGKLVADPQSQKNNSNTNTPTISLGETIDFKLDGYTTAGRVCIAGTFNNWKPDNIFMQKTTTGWSFPYTLAAGNYQYKFIVDGRWMTDPANKHKVDLNGQTNSFLSVKPNVTFTLKGYPKARTVRISGTLNDWDENGYTLVHEGDKWTISLRVKPGKCLYKFIVDGKWVLDNTNDIWEQNEFNTGNSVKWIER